MLLATTQHVDRTNATAANSPLTVMVCVQWEKSSAGDMMKHTSVMLPTVCGMAVRERGTAMRLDAVSLCAPCTPPQPHPHPAPA